MSQTTIVLITLIAYKFILLGVGFWASKRVSDDSDFFLASGGEGGGLGPWTAGLSYAASTSSAWVLLGFTGMVFTQGAVGLWLVPGIFGGYLMTWLVMGPKLNADTAAKGHITIVDFITDGMGDGTGDGMGGGIKRATGLLCAALILFCFVFYISSQFQAAGNALDEVFGLGMAEAVILGAVVIVAYCLLGGFWAASLTDALQAGVMLLACILVPVATVMAAGGVGSVIETLHATEHHDYFSFTKGAVGMAGVGVAMGLFGTGLGALGQPQLLNRIMAVRTQAERKQAAAITIGWGIVIYSGLICLAFAGRALQIETGGESLFFAAAQAYLPAVLAGIVIAAVLSAVMSTVDSLLLAAASAVSHDSGIQYETPKRALLFGRLAMAAVAVIAVVLTLFLPQEIFSRVLFSWVALGAAFGPVILARCLGMAVRDIFKLAAIFIGFVVAVTAYGIDGTLADVVEKWGSWAAGLIILFLGRKR